MTSADVGDSELTPAPSDLDQGRKLSRERVEQLREALRARERGDDPNGVRLEDAVREVLTRIGAQP